MATSNLLFSRLRPLRSFSYAPLCSFLHTSIPTPIPVPPHVSSFQSSVHPFASFHFFHSRSTDIDDSVRVPAAFQSEINNLIESSGIEDSILPVRALVSVLDSYHELTGLPWWIIITSSVLALRTTLLPVVIMQLRKAKEIAESFPKLPPPFPPPLSGRSFIDQFLLFRKERKAIGCPSFLWFLSSISVQVPCFLLFVTAIRRMSLDCHPGFDCGGILWFKNLTELPHGMLGSIFPIVVAGLHYTNVQIAFKGSTVGKGNGLFGLLAKYYKFYLDVLTLPLLLVGFCIPQGSLVYWATNSSLSAIQQLSLKHPAVRAKLGLPDKDAPTAVAKSDHVDKPEIAHLNSASSKSKISVEDLNPEELVKLSVLLLSKGENERPISLLKQALDKDPDYVNALITIGRVLIQEELPAEGAEYLERAVFKLMNTGDPTKAEDVDQLIIASQWAGLAYTHQRKMAEGIAHLERIANLKEPEEPKSKANYFSGLVMLSSALLNEGRKAEAAKHLRLAAAYNPEYNQLLEQCESEEDKDFVSDLANSRRGDY